MSTHVNGIVQSTRRILAIEAELRDLATGPARRRVERTWTAETDARLALVKAALADGVNGETITWAVEMQTPINRARVDLIRAALTVMALSE